MVLQLLFPHAFALFEFGSAAVIWETERVGFLKSMLLIGHYKSRGAPRCSFIKIKILSGASLKNPSHKPMQFNNNLLSPPITCQRCFPCMLLGEQKISEKRTETSMTTLRAPVFYEKYKIFRHWFCVPQTVAKRVFTCGGVKDKEWLLLYMTQKRVLSWLDGFFSTWSSFILHENWPKAALTRRTGSWSS